MTPAELAARLAHAGQRIAPEVARTVTKAAVNVKEDWRRQAAEKNRKSARHYPGTIVQKRGQWKGDEFTAEVETLPRGQGLLGVILEYGGPHSAPQLSNVRAAEREAPELAKWLAKAGGKL